MPDTRLILHVKGTEAQTSELPKDVVRNAISQGKITHSQLIWSAAENAWKQVREWPDLLPPIEQLILHVKGTEAETRQLPKHEVRAGIFHGQITHSQLIWSPAENAWKQVRELPDLMPSQKLAPAPTPSTALPKVDPVVVPESPSGPVAHAALAAEHQPKVPVALTGAPKVKVAAATPQARVPTVAGATPQAQGPAAQAVTPKVAVAAAPQAQVPSVTGATPKVKVASATPRAPVPSVAGTAPKVKVATASPGGQKPRFIGAGAIAAAREAAIAPGRFQGALEVENEEHSHPVKWLCIGLGIFVAVVLALNFILVDYPLTSKLSKTSHSGVSVYAHFGAFMQPNVMVIHIPASTKITEENLPDLLIALAHSSPGNPVTGNLFSRVAITSGWTAQYSFSGDSWKALANEDQETEAQRKDFLMGQMDGPTGESLVPESTLNEQAQKAKREQIWQAFVAHFAKG